MHSGPWGSGVGNIFNDIINDSIFHWFITEIQKMCVKQCVCESKSSYIPIYPGVGVGLEGQTHIQFLNNE